MVIKNIRDVKEKKWSGGITRELYRDKEDFNIRISCAEIDPGISNFSDFTGYNRILKILENQVTLEKNNEIISLDSNNYFVFDGSEKILSKNNNTVLDFNVIYKTDKVSVTFKELEKEKKLFIDANALIFSKSSNTTIKVSKEIKNLNKYDFITIKDKSVVDISGKCLVVLWGKYNSL